MLSIGSGKVLMTVKNIASLQGIVALKIQVSSVAHGLQPSFLLMLHLARIISFLSSRLDSKVKY